MALLQVSELGHVARVVVALRPLDDRLDQQPIPSCTVDRESVVIVGGEEIVRGAVLAVRLSERISIERLPSRPAEVVDGLHHVAAALIVVRERLDELVDPATQMRLHASGDSLVERLTVSAEQPVVRDLLRERVLEDVLELAVDVSLADEIGGGQAGEALLEVLGSIGHRLHDPVEELASDDRCLAEHSPRFRCEVVDARRDEPADRRRHGHRVEARREHPRLALAGQHAVVDEGVHQLFDEERVAVSARRRPSRPARPAVRRRRAATSAARVIDGRRAH